jgi:glycogen phosphorylase
MHRYVPLPPLPARIGRLNELAYDLWWSWNASAREVFRDLDFPLWRFTDHNPVLLLHLVEPDRLEFAAADPDFLRLYDAAIAALDVVRAGAGTWWAEQAAARVPIAWIAPQFALHQSLPVTVTADGVVSGDCCKEASDLGVPFVGVGLMFPRAHKHQRMTADGWQEESVEYLDWSDAPVRPALCDDGAVCQFTITLGANPVHICVWQVRAGRASVYLLDADVRDNAPWDRELSSRRCRGDAESLLRQSVLLGAGAVAALDRLGIEPGMWHLAGAAATPVILERLHRRVAGGESFADALMAVRSSTVFSARENTPAAQGSFSFASVERTIHATWPALSAQREALLAAGRQEVARHDMFNASVFGARGASRVLIVETADEAAETARIEQELSADDPGAAAEGVHLSTWMSSELAAVLDTWIGASWRDTQDDPLTWERLDALPDDVLWALHGRLRGYLVDFMRDRARSRWVRDQAGGSSLVAVGTLFDASALTIGCAPRFDAHGNAEVLFQDADRLARIATAARHPVQFVFAGRADAADDAGKHHLQRLFRHTLDPAFGGRLAFLEDYDLHVARLMVQGCDVWLSAPPHAGAPSLGAMKAAVNGVPHVGQPSAWHAGAFTGENGWLIDSTGGRDAASQDAASARALYALIEERIVPAFYERDRNGVPVAWVRTLRQTLRAGLPRCCARRMVKVSALGVLGS